MSQQGSVFELKVCQLCAGSEQRHYIDFDELGFCRCGDCALVYKN